MQMTMCRWAQQVGAAGTWLAAVAVIEYFQLVKLTGLIPLFGFGMVATAVAIARWQRKLAGQPA